MANVPAPLPSNAPPGLSAPLIPPPASTALADAFRATRDPHPDVGPPPAYPPAVQAEARKVLAAVRPYAQRVPDAVLRAWLAPIQASVRNPSDERRLPAWVAAVRLAVGNLEVGAFTEATQQHALQTFKFFPSGADIYEVLAGPAVQIRALIRTLERIVEGPTA